MTAIDYHKILESFVYSEKDPLLFNSGFFLFFFCFFLMAYALFFKTSKARIYFLTLFSLFVIGQFGVSGLTSRGRNKDLGPMFYDKKCKP